MPDWSTLRALHAATRDRPILALMDDPGRVGRFSVQADGMLLDASKTGIDDTALAALVALAEAAGVGAAREAMFAGRPINATEGRAVLHTALRDPAGPPLVVAGEDVRPGIAATLARMSAFAEAVRAGAHPAAGGPVRDVVNIGIGGSDLGPAMAAAALAPYGDGPRLHFLSNVDGAHAADILRGLDPARTLVIVASKTFTTIETMTNAETVRDWLVRGGGDVGLQVAAVSSATERTARFGIDPARVFGFGDWVGGRYSMWGPVGLALMIGIGPARFAEMLAGAAAMDAHFRTAPLARNMPVMLALSGMWHAQVAGHATRAVLPYDQRLHLLPAYLQQLEMESNGKGVTMAGARLGVASGPVVWGAPGTNGQHAFHQLLHQGTQIVPAEFLIAARGHEAALAHHHRILVANCLAQSEALMRGRSEAEAEALMRRAGLSEAEARRLAPHRAFPGNRPSVTLAYPQLTPFVLGQIVALYEHRVFVEGVCLGINSFDQWGVELGKERAVALLPLVEGRAEAAPAADPSTAALVEFLRRG
ncbi:MAG: glucose-6-phosphate isomerase [Gemmobacter sp.]